MNTRLPRRLLTILLSAVLLLAATPALAYPPTDSNPPGGDGNTGSGSGGAGISRGCEGSDWVVKELHNGRYVETSRIKNAAACPKPSDAFYKDTGLPVDCTKENCWERFRFDEYRTYPFCHRGYFVWRFYGTEDNPTMYRSRTWMPNQSNCRVESYVFPVPHPLDGGASQSFVNSLGWTSKQASGSTPAVNYPSARFRVGASCGSVFEDNAKLKNQYFSGDLLRPITPPSENDSAAKWEAYSEELAKASTRAAFWRARGQLRTQVAARNLPLSIADLMVNTRPNDTRTFLNHNTGRVETTINYGDGIPCSSPLDFAYNVSGTGQTNKISGVPVFGTCWVGVGQEYVQQPIPSNPNIHYAVLSGGADPFFYTRRSWINPGESNRPNLGATPTNSRDLAVINSYRNYLRGNLPSSVPARDASEVRNTISQQARRWQNTSRPVFHTWTPDMIANEATCHFGRGEAINASSANVQQPVLELSPTAVSGSTDTFVAGTSIDWGISFHRGALRCIRGDCSGVQLNSASYTWDLTASYPSSWTRCDVGTIRRATCDYTRNATTESNGDVYRVISNYFTATRPGEAITYRAHPTARVFWVPSSSTAVATLRLGWYFSNGGGTDIAVALDPGGAASARWIEVPGPGASRTVRVGGPYLTPRR